MTGPRLPADENIAASLVRPCVLPLQCGASAAGRRQGLTPYPTLAAQESGVKAVAMAEPGNL